MCATSSVSKQLEDEMKLEIASQNTPLLLNSWELYPWFTATKTHYLRLQTTLHSLLSVTQWLDGVLATAFASKTCINVDPPTPNRQPV